MHAENVWLAGVMKMHRLPESVCIADFSGATVGKLDHATSHLMRFIEISPFRTSHNHTQPRIMSLRTTTIRTSRIAYRYLSTTVPRLEDAQPQAGPSTGFSQLSNLFNQSALTSPAAPSVPEPTPRLAPLLSTDGPQRGYMPAQLPPAVDPVLDLLTNMLMKHGEKGAAEAKVTKILELL